MTCNLLVTYNGLVNSDSVFHALANESRRKLLDLLCEKNGRTLGELCEGFKESRQAVMKHLRILEEANLIAIQWQGREKLHFLNPIPLQETFGRWIAKYERNRLRALDDLKTVLERGEELSAPKKRKTK